MEFALSCSVGDRIGGRLMIYEDGERGLQAVLFPVDEVDVYAETEPGVKEKIRRKKALVNADTRRVLSVVNRTYNVVLNRDALRLAEKCCIAAFPNTAPANWRVFSVEAPKTGGTATSTWRTTVRFRRTTGLSRGLRRIDTILSSG